jgi:hypothetical protein
MPAATVLTHRRDGNQISLIRRPTWLHKPYSR